VPAAGAARQGQVGTVPTDFEKLIIAPGFLLGLEVEEDSDFDGSFRVDEEGNIDVPHCGTVHVAGATINQARLRVRQKLLDEQQLKDPQVLLSVIEYSTAGVTVLGEVVSPGKYSLIAPHRLVDVLALAGGPNALAGNEVQITSSGPGSSRSLIRYSKMTDPRDVENVLINPGDTILVKRAGVIFVLGAVTRPGGFVMQEDGELTLLQAVSLAWGTTAVASTGKVYLLRRNEDGTRVQISLPYKEIVHGKRGDVSLRASDILYVPTSGIKAAVVDSQAILSSAATSAIYRAMD
jgi:polysaccharide export outer membrane protein